MGRPRKVKTPAAVYDGLLEGPTLTQWNEQDMALPVQGLARLQREGDRGMMPSVGELDPVYSKFISQLDADELKFALSLDTNSPKVAALLSDIVNPLQKISITTLAKRHGIGLPEMMGIWRNYKLVVAMGKFIDHAPVLAEHVAIDAESVYVCCPRCDGAGVVCVNRRESMEWIDCPSCQAKGTIRRPGDPKARDLALQAIGFTKSSSGSTVTVNVNQNNSPVESVIDELDQLHATPYVDIEAE